MKIKKLFIAAFIALGIYSVPIYAAESKLELTDADIVSKSSTTDAEDIELKDNIISSNITFNKKNDFIEFTLTLKNISSSAYQIKTIKDNIGDGYLTAEYSYSKDMIRPDTTAELGIKLTYAKQVLNQQKVSLDNLEIKITLGLDDGGEKEEEVIINPSTHDNAVSYVAIASAFTIGLILVLIFVKNKKLRIGIISAMALASIAFPIAVLASEGGEATIKFTNIDLIGEFETYRIVIDPDNGENPIEKQISYGEALGDLPSDPIKEGYEFAGWVDGSNNQVTPETIITSEISVKAAYTPINYSISFTLGDGVSDPGNPSQYNIETTSFDLKNPQLQGYSFSGWTGTNITGMQVRVTINKGTIGNLEFTAHFSPNDDTSFTVSHHYANLNGGYDTYVEHLTGTTNTDVVAAFREQTGFKNPASTQSIHIDASGKANLDYYYEREEYSFSIPDRTYIDNSSTSDGTYPYGTIITVKAKERAGYDFAGWSDGSSEIEHSFNLSDETQITPSYTARTDTPYTVLHQTMDLDGIHYTTIYEQHLTGTTDRNITPSTVEYTGFGEATKETKPISGEGDTVFTYQYPRLKFMLTLTNSEDIDTTAESKEYFYGTKITLKAKEKIGYDFAGWSNGDTNAEITITIGAEATTIGPEYTKKSFTVTFNPTDGTMAEADRSRTVKYNEQLGELPEASYENHNLLGWFTSSEGGDQVSATTVITDNVEYFAHWSESGVTLEQAYERAGKQKISVGGNQYYTMQDMDNTAVCGAATIIGDTLDVVDTRDNNIYTISKLQDNRCWMLNNLALNIVDANIRANMTTSNTNTTGRGLAMLENTAIGNAYFDHRPLIIEADKNMSRTSSMGYVPIVEDEENWKYGIYYNYCAASGGTDCEEADSVVNDRQEFFDICPSGWHLPTAGYQGDYSTLVRAVTGDDSLVILNNHSNVANTEQILEIRKSLRLPYAGEYRMGSINDRDESNSSFYGQLWSSTRLSANNDYINSFRLGYREIELVNSSAGQAPNIRCIAEDSALVIEFEPNGGTIHELDYARKVANDSTLGELPRATREGYIFQGWFTAAEGGNQINESTVPTQNTTYYAHWQDNRVNVSFDPTDGTMSESDKNRLVERGKEIGELPDATRDGFELVGWFTDAQSGDRITSETIINDGATYYAHWENSRYVAYANNKYYEVLQEAFDEAPDTGTTTVLLLQDLVRDEYIDLNSKNLGKKYIFDLNGHTITNNDTQIIDTKAEIEVKNGKLVCGAEAGAVNISASTGKFIINSGRIEAKGKRQAIYNNGGTVLIGGTAYLSSVTSQRSAVQMQSGTLIITGGTIVSDSSSAVKINGGAFTLGTQDGRFDRKAIELRGATYGVETGRAINVYDGTLKGVSAAINDESRISGTESGFAKTHATEEIDGRTYQTLYYRSAYTITLNANGGSVSPSSLDVERGEKITNLPTPTRTGYTFLEWNTKIGGDGVTYDNDTVLHNAIRSHYYG